MSVPLDYKDIVTIVKTGLSSEGYTTEYISETQSVPALFIANTGWLHNDNQDEVTTDAEVYLDPEDPYVVDNHNRLEGMLLIAKPFGQDSDESWYRIITVRVGVDKLLDNEINNVLCFLKKSTKINYVS